jgi:hypothetical protein
MRKRYFSSILLPTLSFLPPWQVAGDAEIVKESLAESEEASRNLRSFKKKQKNRKERSHDISQTTEEASPIKASSCDTKKAEKVNGGAHTAGFGDILSILKGATVGYKFLRKLSKTSNRKHLGHPSVNTWRYNIDIHCFYTLQCRCSQRRSCWGRRHFEWYREPQESGASKHTFTSSSISSRRKSDHAFFC